MSDQVTVFRCDHCFRYLPETDVHDISWIRRLYWPEKVPALICGVCFDIMGCPASSPAAVLRGGPTQTGPT
jgi:hypothetical protein